MKFQINGEVLEIKDYYRSPYLYKLAHTDVDVDKTLDGIPIINDVDMDSFVSYMYLLRGSISDRTEGALVLIDQFGETNPGYPDRLWHAIVHPTVMKKPYHGEQVEKFNLVSPYDYIARKDSIESSIFTTDPSYYDNIVIAGAEIVSVDVPVKDFIHNIFPVNMQALLTNGQKEVVCTGIGKFYMHHDDVFYLSAYDMSDDTLDILVDKDRQVVFVGDVISKFVPELADGVEEFVVRYAKNSPRIKGYTPPDEFSYLWEKAPTETMMNLIEEYVSATTGSSMTAIMYRRIGARGWIYSVAKQILDDMGRLDIITKHVLAHLEQSC